MYPPLMTAPAKTPEPKDRRAERLAAALRENLKRRKAQERAKERAKKEPTTPDAGKD